MKFRVYYSDAPWTLEEVEATDSVEAAKLYFFKHLRLEPAVVTVESTGFDPERHPTRRYNTPTFWKDERYIRFVKNMGTADSSVPSTQLESGQARLVATRDAEKKGSRFLSNIVSNVMGVMILLTFILRNLTPDDSPTVLQKSPTPPPAQYLAFVQSSQNKSPESPRGAFVFAYTSVALVRVPPATISNEELKYAKHIDFGSSEFQKGKEYDGNHDVYIVDGDADLEIGDLEDENSLESHLEIRYGNVTHIGLEFSESPRGPPSRNSIKTIYIRGTIQNVKLPSLYAGSSLYANIIDLQPSKEEWQKYQSELYTYARRREKSSAADYERRSEPVHVEMHSVVP